MSSLQQSPLSNKHATATRRRHVRVVVRFVGRIFCLEENLPCIVADISPGGVYVRCDRQFKKETPCRLTMQVPNGETKEEIQVEGHVSWHDGAGMGIRFHTLTPLALMQILRVVHGNSSKQGNR